MKSYEKYKELKKSIQDQEVRLPGLGAELRTRMDKQKALEEEALKGEVLKDDEKAKKKAAEENKTEISRLLKEIEKIDKGVKIIHEALEKTRAEALAEIKETYREPFAKAAKKYAAGLKEARKLEQEMKSIGEEADKMALSVDCPFYTISVPILRPVLVVRGERGELTDRVQRFCDECKEEGIEVA